MDVCGDFNRDNVCIILAACVIKTQPATGGNNYLLLVGPKNRVVSETENRTLLVNHRALNQINNIACI